MDYASKTCQERVSQLMQALDSQPLQALILDRFEQEIARARLLVKAAAGAMEAQLRETLSETLDGSASEAMPRPRRRYRRWGASRDEIRLRVFSTMIGDPRARYRLRDLPTSVWRFVGKGQRALWSDIDALNADFANWRVQFAPLDSIPEGEEHYHP